MQNKTKHFIFDFDGVLGNTWDAAVRAVMEVNGMTRDEAVENLIYYFKKPRHSRKNHVTKERLEQWLEWTNRFGHAMAKIGFELFDDFIAEIKKIEDKKLAIVSSGSKQYVKKIKDSGLNFSHVLTFEDSPSKEEKVEKICRDWNIGAKDAYYFTDTRTDVMELKEMLGDKIRGCSWGYHGLYGLLEVLPEDRILQEFTDIHLVE